MYDNWTREYTCEGLVFIWNGSEGRVNGKESVGDGN